MDYRTTLLSMIQTNLDKGMQFKDIAILFNKSNNFTPNGAMWGPGPLSAFYKKYTTLNQIPVKVFAQKIQTIPKIDFIEEKIGTFMDAVFRMNIPRDKKVFVTTALNDILDKLAEE